MLLFRTSKCITMKKVLVMALFLNYRDYRILPNHSSSKYFSYYLKSSISFKGNDFQCTNKSHCGTLNELV